eukprot:SAG31_NODE_1384_length_8578_cov_2.883359_3_plen_41_part_00
MVIMKVVPDQRKFSMAVVLEPDSQRECYVIHELASVCFGV